VEKWLKGHWPPRWLAFYQTKVFGDEAFSVRYYSQVVGIRQVSRHELFPDQPQDDKAQRRYYQLLLGPLQRRSEPIPSRRWRRITFIPTTWTKFEQAAEINELYRESALEERLWQQLKLLNIPAERQEFVTVKGRSYALDFAVYCAKGKIDIETDGDIWHTGPQHAPRDNTALQHPANQRTTGRLLPADDRKEYQQEYQRAGRCGRGECGGASGER